jgi:hypothetical protein
VGVAELGIGKHRRNPSRVLDSQHVGHQDHLVVVLLQQSFQAQTLRPCLDGIPVRNT